MIRVLPIIFIIILILGGLVYWRYFTPKPTGTNLTSAQPRQEEASQSPVEVPKTLPNATAEERVEVLEKALVELAKRVNYLTSQQTAGSTLDARINTVESSIIDLKTQISTLGQAAPAASSTQSTTYIPIGAGGSWDYSSWTTLTDYQINLDPANFPGYNSMVLEVIFRVVDSTSIASVRFYNTSDNTAVSSEVSTGSSSFSLGSSAFFNLASGSKTYALQVKNSAGKTFLIQLARLKVSY